MKYVKMKIQYIQVLWVDYFPPLFSATDLCYVCFIGTNEMSGWRLIDWETSGVFREQQPVVFLIYIYFFFHFTIHFQRNPVMYCEKKNQWRHRGWQTRTGWHRKHRSLHHLHVGELENSQGVSQSFASPTFLAATLDTCLVPVFYSQISDLRNARLVQLRAPSVLPQKIWHQRGGVAVSLS